MIIVQICYIIQSTVITIPYIDIIVKFFLIGGMFMTNEKPITICVESENKTALRLYSSSGFNIISQYEYYQTKI